MSVNAESVFQPSLRDLFRSRIYPAVNYQAIFYFRWFLRNQKPSRMEFGHWSLSDLDSQIEFEFRSIFLRMLVLVFLTMTVGIEYDKDED